MILILLFLLPVLVLLLLGWDLAAAGYSVLLFGFVAGALFARWAIVAALSCPRDPSLTKLYLNVAAAVGKRVERMRGRR